MKIAVFMCGFAALHHIFTCVVGGGISGEGQRLMDMGGGGEFSEKHILKYPARLMLIYVCIFKKLYFRW